MYGLPNTEISEHFLRHDVIIIETSVGSTSQGTDGILFSYVVFILRALVVSLLEFTFL